MSKTESKCDSESFSGKNHMPKILLVEDNEMNRDMLSRRLERRGYQIVTAENGEQGLSLARLEAPVLILMDITLREGGGGGFARGWRGDQNSRHIPIIAL